MQLSIGGQTIAWDSDEHPHWPPVDRDGKIISDLPWKFFDPGAQATRRVAEKMRAGQPAGHDGTHNSQEACDS